MIRPIPKTRLLGSMFKLQSWPLNFRLQIMKWLPFNKIKQDLMKKRLSWRLHFKPLRVIRLTFSKRILGLMVKWMSLLTSFRSLRVKQLPFNKRTQDLIIKWRSWTPYFKKLRSQRNKSLRLNLRTCTLRTQICKNRWEYSLNGSKRKESVLLMLLKRGISILYMESFNRHCSVTILPLRVRLDSQSVMTSTWKKEQSLKSEILSLY